MPARKADNSVEVGPELHSHISGVAGDGGAVGGEDGMLGDGGGDGGKGGILGE